MAGPLVDPLERFLFQGTPADGTFGGRMSAVRVFLQIDNAALAEFMVARQALGFLGQILPTDGTSLSLLLTLAIGMTREALLVLSQSPRQSGEDGRRHLAVE